REIRRQAEVAGCVDSHSVGVSTVERAAGSDGTKNVKGTEPRISANDPVLHLDFSGFNKGQTEPMVISSLNSTSNTNKDDRTILNSNNLITETVARHDPVASAPISSSMMGTNSNREVSAAPNKEPEKSDHRPAVRQAGAGGIEKHRPSKGPPQCHRCQSFGHIDKACNMPPRCVKCGNNHLTSECKKEAAEAAMCANCKGDHPASYRGCPSYLKLKERLRELKEKALQKSQRNVGNDNLKTPSKATANTTTPKRVLQSKATGNSYADIAKGIGRENDQVKCTHESVTPSSLEIADIIDNGIERNDNEDWRNIMSYDVFRDDDTKPIRGTAVIVAKEFNAKKISLPSFNKISATGAVINGPNGPLNLISIKNINDIDSAMSKFTNLVGLAYLRGSRAKRRVPPGRVRLPFYILDLIKKRNRARKDLQKINSTFNIAKYKTLRALVQKEVRRFKNAQITKVIDISKCNEDKNELWKNISRITGKKSANASNLVINNHTLVNDKDKSEAFCEFLANQYIPFENNNDRLSDLVVGEVAGLSLAPTPRPCRGQALEKGSSGAVTQPAPAPSAGSFNQPLPSLPVLVSHVPQNSERVTTCRSALAEQALSTGSGGIPTNCSPPRDIEQNVRGVGKTASSIPISNAVVNRETVEAAENDGWTTVKQRRGGREGAATASPTTEDTIPRQNRFDLIADNELIEIDSPNGPPTAENTAIKNRFSKIPPIYIDKVKNWMQVFKKMREVCSFPPVARVAGRRTVVRCQTIADFFLVKSLLAEANEDFFTYRLASEKKKLYVIRDLPFGINTDDIRESLEDQGIMTTRVVQMQTTKPILSQLKEGIKSVPARLLPLFLIELHDATPSVELLALKYVCGLKIRIEKHRPPKGPPLSVVRAH
ncbi:hypothetical protein J437_LFUL019347, partial [Ladona fulva]